MFSLAENQTPIGMLISPQDELDCINQAPPLHRSRFLDAQPQPHTHTTQATASNRRGGCGTNPCVRSNRRNAPESYVEPFNCCSSLRTKCPSPNPCLIRHLTGTSHTVHSQDNSQDRPSQHRTSLAGAYLRLLGHSPSLRSSASPLGLRLSALLAGPGSAARLRLPGHLLLLMNRKRRENTQKWPSTEE